jgi:integrase
MTDQKKNSHPGIRRVTTSKGEVRYRLIVDMGERADGKRDQRCETFTRLGDAKARQSEIKNSREKRTLVKPTKTTFDELCQRWLDSRHDVREITRLGYADSLKIARAQLGRVKVQDLTRTHIEGLIRSLRDDHGLSHRSIVYTLGSIRQVLAYGISAGLISVNVAASVKAPRKQHGDTRPKVVWEPAELLAFRAVADQDQLAAAWRLTLCGLRRSEIMGLSWTAVDLERGEVHIQAGRVKLVGARTTTDDPKSRKTVPVEDIQPGTVALLRSLKARQAAGRLVLGAGYQETGLVVVDALGAPIRPEGYSDRFTLLCRRAGVPVVHLHSVRHTLATIMHKAGLAPADAAALLGHTVAIHLASYVTPTQKGARTAARGLGSALAGLG